MKTMLPSLGNVILLKEKGGWESHFPGRLIKSPGSPRRREAPGIPEEKQGVWGSQGEEKDIFFFLHCFVFSSVAQSYLTLCNPLDCSMPGFPVHHWLTELTQTHVHWVGDAIQPPYPLVITFSSCLQSFPASGSFPISQFLASGGQKIGVSASASVLPMNVQDWFPLGWTDWITLQSKRLSRVFSNTTVQKYLFFGSQIALATQMFVGKVMSLLFNMLSRLVITSLPRRKRLLISWLQSLSAVILEPKKIKSVTVSTVSPSTYHDVIGLDNTILVFWKLGFKQTF